MPKTSETPARQDPSGHQNPSHLIGRADEHHHSALPDDLKQLIARRQTLRLITSGAAACLVGACDNSIAFPGPEPEQTALSPDGSECIVHPTETAGPFPADGSNNAHGTLANVLDDSGIRRRDIRPDLGAGRKSAAGGIKLDLTINLLNVGEGCAPLEGYALYLWHCDAEGQYSIYNVAEHNYLRGLGISDTAGNLHFTTIIPGCYWGRYPHIHFEVYPNPEAATDYRNRLLTSQLALPPKICEAVYSAHPLYSKSLENLKNAPLERDMIFTDNTPKQLSAQTIRIKGGIKTGLQGEVTIGVMDKTTT